MTNTQKYIVSLGLAGVLLAGGASLVLAEDSRPAVSGSVMMPGAPSKQMQPVVNVGPNGNTLLRGTLSAVGTTTLTVKSWGGDWTVNVSTSTQLMPMTMMSQFKVGDFVGVQGTASTTGLWTVDAKLVRDWSARKEAGDTRKEIQDMMKASTPRNWEGVATNVNVAGNTFTLTVDGTAYTVTLATGAKVVNQAYGVLSLADIKSGDTVRIYATISGTTATASVVRDVSVK